MHGAENGLSSWSSSWGCPSHAADDCFMPPYGTAPALFCNTTQLPLLLPCPPAPHTSPAPPPPLRFVVVMHGPDERRTPGNTLVVQPDKPFTGLAQVGRAGQGRMVDRGLGRPESMANFANAGLGGGCRGGSLLALLCAGAAAYVQRAQQSATGSPRVPPSPHVWQFGSGFLSKFECAQCDNRLLEEVTLVDTPGELLSLLLLAKL